MVIPGYNNALVIWTCKLLIQTHVEDNEPENWNKNEQFQLNEKLSKLKFWPISVGESNNSVNLVPSFEKVPEDKTGIVGAVNILKGAKYALEYLSVFPITDSEIL